MIVVATDDFELYHDLVDKLKSQEADFTTAKPGDSLPDSATVLLCSPEDPVPDDSQLQVIRATPDGIQAAVEKALTVGRSDDAQRVIGVDPGDKPGIAVVVGNTVVAVFQVPASNAPDVIHEEAANHDDVVVRVGDGARIKGAQIIDSLDDDLSVELVDETRTTPVLGAGASGTGDIIAAINIAGRPGDTIDARDVDPTTGELQEIKQESRQKSPENREISTQLAKAVANGEMSLQEALAKHRNSSS